MSSFAHLTLSRAPEATAPDGSRLRVLLELEGGGMIHLELGVGEVSKAVVHRSVEELWYILSGRGEMWRRRGEREELVPLGEGDSLSLPVGTAFQFRAIGDAPLRAVAVTMPPWPGEEEAVPVEGRW